MYLEKSPGHPAIDQLQTLHLFEADYNLLLKWFSSLGFLPKSEKAGWLHASQGGSQPSQSTIDLACKKSVLYDYIHITCSPAIDLSKDIAKFFDSMIEACTSLLCHQWCRSQLPQTPCCNATTVQVLCQTCCWDLSQIQPTQPTGPMVQSGSRSRWCLSSLGSTSHQYYPSLCIQSTFLVYSWLQHFLPTSYWCIYWWYWFIQCPSPAPNLLQFAHNHSRKFGPMAQPSTSQWRHSESK